MKNIHLLMAFAVVSAMLVSCQRQSGVSFKTLEIISIEKADYSVNPNSGSNVDLGVNGLLTMYLAPSSPKAEAPGKYRH